MPLCLPTYLPGGQLHRLRTSQAYLVSGVLYKWSRWPLASTQMVEERAYAAAAGTASLRIGAPLSKRPTLPGIGAKRQRSLRSHQLLSSSTQPLKLPGEGPGENLPSRKGDRGCWTIVPEEIVWTRGLIGCDAAPYRAPRQEVVHPSPISSFR